MRRFTDNSPREITAKFNSVCAETGKPILKGQSCIFYPSVKKVYCLDSKQAGEYRSISFDNDVLGCNY